MAPRIPTPVRSIDVYALPLSTLEGFVLSLVDGVTPVEDIAMMSRVEPDKLLTILERLAELGAVELSWMAAKNSAKPRPAEPRAAADAHFSPTRSQYTPTDLDGNVGISIEVRRRILNAYHAIEGRDFYWILGVPREAEKKVIRNAYFELSKVFHPDAYFGKDLGTFKPRMETVFKRLTEAYEVLGKASKRAEYDEYLATTEQTRRTLDSIQFTREEVEKVRRKSQQRMAAVTPAAVESSSARPKTPEPGTPESTPSSKEPAAPVAPRPQPSKAERRARVRDRLRQRFDDLQSQRPPPPPAAPVSQPAPEQRRQGVLDGLRSSILASSAMSGTPQAQMQSHVKRAKDAEQAGDILLAASQLQAALAIDPNAQEVLAEYDRVSKVVARNLAGNYEKQALYEEKTGNWDAAARSWARVSDGRPEDDNAARRAAEAMLKATSDLHRAQKYAQKAVSLDGRSLPNLTVLARVYLAAGLKLNALRELEKAAHLAPNDEMVNNLLREAR
jgi:tetratricopeptide (TPR) repeat protein